MQTKIIIFIIVIGLSLGLYYQTQSSKELPPTNITPIQPELLNTTLKLDQSVQKEQKDIDQSGQSKTQGSEEIELLEQVYDSDPVVDANIIINNNSLCIRQLANDINDAKHQERFIEKLDAKQKKFYKDFLTHCQKLDQKHPEYHLSDEAFLKKQIHSAKPTSLWGQIINGEIEASELSDFEVQDLLKQNNLSILTDAPKYLRNYYQQVIHWELEDVLQNHQYDYTNHIRHYAHQLYLCQIGGDCTPNSTTMAMLCYLNTHACGLNYPQYIENVLTLGQQTDIKLAVNYLKGKYN